MSTRQFARDFFSQLFHSFFSIFLSSLNALDFNYQLSLPLCLTHSLFLFFSASLFPDKKFPCGGSKFGNKDIYEVEDFCTRHFFVNQARIFFDGDTSLGIGIGRVSAVDGPINAIRNFQVFAKQKLIEIGRTVAGSVASQTVFAASHLPNTDEKVWKYNIGVLFLTISWKSLRNTWLMF